MSDLEAKISRSPRRGSWIDHPIRAVPYILAAGLAVAIAVPFGIRCYSAHKPHPREVELVGRPISVSAAHWKNYSNLSVLVQDAQGRQILTSSVYGETLLAEGIQDATTVINAEINDSDDEQITLRGFYDRTGRFRFRSVHANGLDVSVVYSHR